VQGLELSRRFYFEAVRPILDRRLPHVEHAAALIGPGSEVLGFDDAISTDHHWGPRVLLFVRDTAVGPEIDRVLAAELPTAFAGFSTHFGTPDEIGVRLLVPIESGPVAHRVEVFELGEFLRERLGRDPRDGLAVADWLATPTQRLLEVTAGAVFADPIGELTKLRELLAWYPNDVWLIVMAAYWSRIGELEHFLGRTGALGDELGSRVIAASLVNDLMRLALLQERRYPPYAKWLGTAYGELGRPERECLEQALATADWRTRERALAEAYEHAARRHNDLGVTAPIDATERQFHNRPFRVIGGDRFAAALRAAATDPAVRAVRDDVVPVDAPSVG
jgi:uncharacterized protein DUF4037